MSLTVQLPRPSIEVTRRKVVFASAGALIGLFVGFLVSSSLVAFGSIYRGVEGDALQPGWRFIATLTQIGFPVIGGAALWMIAGMKRGVAEAKDLYERVLVIDADRYWWAALPVRELLEHMDYRARYVAAQRYGQWVGAVAVTATFAMMAYGFSFPFTQDALFSGGIAFWAVIPGVPVGFQFGRYVLVRRPTWVLWREGGKLTPVLPLALTDQYDDTAGILRGDSFADVLEHVETAERFRVNIPSLGKIQIATLLLALAGMGVIMFLMLIVMQE